MQKFKLSLVFAIVVFALAAVGALASAPAVRKVTVAPVVDGNKATFPNEWNTTIGGPDWYSPMCTGNDVVPCTGAEHGDVFLQFKCTTSMTGTLFVLMLADRGYPYSVGDSVNNWIAQDTINHKLINDGAPYTTNSAPPMWRDLGTNDGAEVAISKNYAGVDLQSSGVITLNFHIEVAQTATSGTGFIQVQLPSCAPTAVTVSTLSADASDSSLSLALLALGGAGLVVLGGLVFVAARKR